MSLMTAPYGSGFSSIEQAQTENLALQEQQRKTSLQMQQDQQILIAN
jgi:hypothetical protein